MRRVSLLLVMAAAFVATLAPSAHAYTYGPWGCNLRWDHCYGDGGVQNHGFACDTNTGSETLVASFVPAWDIANVSGLQLVIDLASAGATLPAWWQYRNVGTCRLTSLIASSVPTDPLVTNCPDWGGGNQAGGLAPYLVGVYSANSARIVLAWAVAEQSLVSLFGRSEYFANKLTIDHAKTFGTGACGGCTTPVCIVFTSITLATPGYTNDRWLTGPANQVDSDYVTWQGGAGVSTYLGSGCPAATPTKRSTWGSVKALYR